MCFNIPPNSFPLRSVPSIASSFKEHRSVLKKFLGVLTEKQQVKYVIDTRGLKFVSLSILYRGADKVLEHPSLEYRP